MRILIVNDDGIHAEGIRHLAELSKEFGEVWVVAPAGQCSAMSHSISVHGKMLIKEILDFPVEDVKAFSVTGTPVDCVKAAIKIIMPEKPDIVFSGVNNGYNMGHETLYSGTVGIAMDALMYGIPAIAFSTNMRSDFKTVDKYFSMVTRGILDQEPSYTQVWNVNFPGCDPDEVEGVLWNRIPALKEFYIEEEFIIEEGPEGTSFSYHNVEKCEDQPEGTDIQAINKKCISIGMLKNSIL